MGDVRNNVNRVYTGWLMVMGVKNNLHRTGGTRNPNRCGTVFFVNPQNLEADYFLGFWDC